MTKVQLYWARTLMAMAPARLAMVNTSVIMTAPLVIIYNNR